MSIRYYFFVSSEKGKVLYASVAVRLMQGVTQDVFFFLPPGTTDVDVQRSCNADHSIPTLRIFLGEYIFRTHATCSLAATCRVLSANNTSTWQAWFPPGRGNRCVSALWAHPPTFCQSPWVWTTRIQAASRPFENRPRLLDKLVHIEWPCHNSRILCFLPSRLWLFFCHSFICQIRECSSAFSIYRCAYSLRPKINAILWFKICPTRNATLTNQPQKTRESRSFSHIRQANSPVRFAYQPPANSTFLSERISHQQPASSTFLLEQMSTNY
jgi:hypothetical protein